ncbi:MAG: hypothetical protein KC731_29080 [Myxococcales bacterium]|nr:hypothetical protein [Myxococcales bacterium]
MKIASLAFALLLVACGSEDPPSCPEAVATYYGANCSFTDPGSGDPVSEDQASSDCQAWREASPDACNDAFDAFLICLNGVSSDNQCNDCNQAQADWISCVGEN